MSAINVTPRRSRPSCGPGLCLAASLVSTTALAQAPVGNYDVKLDLTVGFTKPQGGEGGLLEAVGLEVDRRLTAHLRVRGMLALGAFASFDRYRGNYSAARAGLAGRTCFGIRVCLDGGLDAAVMHLAESESYNPNYMLDHTSPGVFLRGGLDVGGRVVRAHLAFDAGVDVRSDHVAGLLLGISFQL